MLGSYSVNDGAQLYMIDPSGVSYVSSFWIIWDSISSLMVSLALKSYIQIICFFNTHLTLIARTYGYETAKIFFGLCRMAWGILVNWLGIELVPCVLGACILNHWTTREVPDLWLLIC